MYDAFEQYLITEKMVAVHTVTAYKKDILQCIEFLETLHKTNFADVTVDDMKAFLYHLRMDAKIAASSLARKLSSLKALSKYLQVYHGMHDFMHGISFPKLEKNLPKNLSETDVQTLLEYAQKDSSAQGRRNSVMMALLYVCGLRISELVALTLSDIDFNQGVLHVFGKGSKERLVPLPAEMLEVLQKYIEYIYPELISEQTVKVAYLFPTLYAGQIKAMSRQAFWMILKAITKQAGVQHLVSPHILRHSVATHLLKKGANLRLLQMILGHEQLATVQIYTHMDTSHLRKLYDAKHARA